MIRLKYILLAAALLMMACSMDENDPVVPPGKPEEIACEQSACWDTGVYVCRDSTYIDLFTRSKGWTGGDATYSVDLKNGRTLWMFGDSFIDQVSEDRSRPTFRLINNALVLQEGSKMTTFHGGTAANPQAFAKPPEEGEWYWPGDATVANGKLYLFMHGFGTGGGGAWEHVIARTKAQNLPITANLQARAVEALSKQIGKKIDAVIRFEPAGQTLNTFLAAAELGVPFRERTRIARTPA